MKRLSRNIFSIGIGDIGSRILGFLVTTYLARKLEPEGFGFVNLGLAALGYLFLVTSPGVQLYGTRLAAQGEGSEVRLAGDILGLRLFLAALCFLGTVAATLLFSKGQTLFLLVVLYAASLFPMALTLDWFFQGKEDMRGIGWSRVATNLVYFLFVLLLVNARSDLLRAPVALLVGNLVGAGVLLTAFVRRYGQIHLSWKPSSLLKKEGRWRLILRDSLPIGLGTVMSQISFNLPPVVLGIVSNASAVGYFGAASRVVFFLMLFDRLATTLLLPAIARFHKSSPSQLEPMLSSILKIMLSVSLPVCLGGAVLANKIIPLLFGDQFAAAVPVFQSLIWYFFFSVSSSVYVYGLIGIGQERVYSRLMAWGTALQIGCITVGLLVWGAAGAGGGYALGEALILFLMVLHFNKFFVVRFWPAAWRPLLAGVVMVIAILPIRSHNLLITIPAGAVVFIVALIVSGGLTRDDIVSLKARLL